MTESRHDYEEDIRRLMDDLTANENEHQEAAESHERKGTVRLSTDPIAISLGELPLILGEVSYDKTDLPQADKTEEDFTLILPTDAEVSEKHEDDFNEDAFIQQYINAQRADNEAGGYDDARRASFFGRHLFRRGDSLGAVLRKFLFWAAAALLVVLLVGAMYDLGIRPLIAAQQEQHLADTYDPDAEGTVGEQESRYPKGMLASFRGLYDINPQVVGYIQYHAQAQEDFLQIDYPVVYAGDNTTYLNTNFYGDASVDGTLFLDERCNDDAASLTIVYGKNAANGRMFAGLNSLVGSVYDARAAATLTYSTLYEKNEYRVFAVVLTDESATGSAFFNSCRTSFDTDAEFNEHIKAVKARSLFDYGVDVSASDDVLVLVTDASASVAKISNARIAVYARRVRAGDTTSLIVKNDDVIMPLAWYAAQNIRTHGYYTASSTTTAPTTGTTAAPTTGTTVPSADESDETTTTTTTGTTTTTTTQATQSPGEGDDGVIEMG